MCHYPHASANKYYGDLDVRWPAAGTEPQAGSCAWLVGRVPILGSTTTWMDDYWLILPWVDHIPFCCYHTYLPLTPSYLHTPLPPAHAHGLILPRAFVGLPTCTTPHLPMMDSWFSLPHLPRLTMIHRCVPHTAPVLLCRPAWLPGMTTAPAFPRGTLVARGQLTTHCACIPLFHSNRASRSAG